MTTHTHHPHGAAQRLTVQGIRLGLVALTLLVTACSTTQNIPDDDQLFAGLTKISYSETADTLGTAEPETQKTQSQHLNDTKAEVEAALATAPNGALFGSSYYHTPFSWRLWIYNKYSTRDTKFARWVTKTFGKAPVLMSQVNPALRASVAQSVLRNNGYFRASVDYETVTQRNPRKAKIAYHVSPGQLFTYDSVAYVGFPDVPRQLIDSTASQALVASGQPFSVSSLEGERNRISTLLRNNGYYFYNPAYTTYLADTVATAGQASLRIQLTDGLPTEALRPWYIGNVDIHMRRTVREQATDSLTRRHLTIHFSGKKPPIRPGVVLGSMRLFPRQPFSYDKYQESAARVNATGVFSAVDFQFTPRLRTEADSLAGQADTLDLRLNCTFDKPYDFYFETNVNARTIGRWGPELKVGFAKRNAFHGAEKLDINLHGNYEWQRSNGESMNSYQYGVDASIEFPRIIAPFVSQQGRRPQSRDGERRPRRRRFFTTPTTLAKLSADVINRPDYYRMHVAAGEWTYAWQPSEQSHHQFSPLTLKYQRMNSSTKKFEEVIEKAPYLLATMSDQFIPKMRYTYVYTSPTTLRNPLRWEISLEEAGNLTALYDVVVQGNKWTQKEKTLFKNPYAQFLRVETDLTKTWRLTNNSSLVGHVNAGLIYSYGNQEQAPFSEMFYAGGANSIRAFTVRSIGPGGYIDLFGNRQFNYLLQNGDIKFIGNLEYRTRLFGNLGGAVFLDFGNVWKRKGEIDDFEDAETEEEILWATIGNKLEELSEFRLSRLVDQTAVGTGVGLRYDLGFLVIRIDWGLALHLPYNTGRSGYFNISHFRDAQALHFAVGYPF